VRRALAEPIASPGLKDMVKQGDSALLLIDDNTRNTPASRILPLVLEELAAGGVQIQDTAILIALGTHRHMTDAEVEAKVGAELAGRLRIFQHDAHDESGLAHIGVTEHGTDVWVNKLLLEFDHVIAVGHITPHRVAGFSGGAKMVQPGVSGVVTTGQTHWISALYDGAEIMGTIDNPVRREMNAVAKKAGLSFIVNVVLDREERIYRCVCGDPEKAHAAGCEASREIFGVLFPEYADIVVTDTFPADSELWQAAKGIYAGDLPLKRGGVLITVTPCPEGVAQGHPELTEIGTSPSPKSRKWWTETRSRT
ncbi:MAG TPA: nickel-dependent lactate racemase, partial [Synergistales bacterium]|nr:nickel-dependent lactate racemase [Synergistales bacterium]